MGVRGDEVDEVVPQHLFGKRFAAGAKGARETARCHLHQTTLIDQRGNESGLA
jgi:hypothetical protein